MTKQTEALKMAIEKLQKATWTIAIILAIVIWRIYA